MLCKQHDKSSPRNSTNCTVLYPQNGDSIVAVDFVTLFHPMYLRDRPTCPIIKIATDLQLRVHVQVLGRGTVLGLLFHCLWMPMGLRA